MYSFNISLYMDKWARGGYSYLLDDIVIKDLNAEKPRTGCTWQDPNS